MSDYYRIIKTQKVSNYAYCIITIPFDSHMKTAYTHSLIFTLLTMPVAFLRRFLLRKVAKTERQGWPEAVAGKLEVGSLNFY